MKIMVFGATGFIGHHLDVALSRKGHSVIQRDVRKGDAWQQELAEVDAVVNLGGTPIFGKRWNTQVKSEIYDSRIEGTKKITDAMFVSHKKAQKPAVFVNASAVGYYGTDPEAIFDEDSQSGSDFLAFVCRDWEEIARRASSHDKIRSAIVRFGIVLGKDGGALKQLIPPFKAFVGGPIGFGKQWMSWVHIDDVVNFIIYVIENDQVAGTFNATAPNPVRNKEFSKALGRALHRPALIPVPGLALRVLIGEGAEFLVTGQKVLPKRTQASGYQFKYSDIDRALKDCV